MVHCWENIDYDDWTQETCLLEDDHDVEHEFTPDSDIEVAFRAQRQ